MIIDEQIRLVLAELRSDGSRTHYRVLNDAKMELLRLRVELSETKKKLVESQSLNKAAGVLLK